MILSQAVSAPAQVPELREGPAGQLAHAAVGRGGGGARQQPLPPRRLQGRHIQRLHARGTEAVPGELQLSNICSVGRQVV